jgi:hypothetical protein
MDNPVKPHYRLGINASEMLHEKAYLGFAPCFVNYKKGALDSQPQVIVYQLLAQSRWFSLGTLASSTTKTGRHDIAEIHVSYCHHFSSVVCRPFVNISHFNLLLRNHWANCNQTLVEWSLDCLSKYA